MASTSKKAEVTDAERHKHHDINTKMKMASNIVKACKIESQSGKLLHNYALPIDRTQTYAKTHQYLIYKCKTMNRIEMSYRNFEGERTLRDKMLKISYDKVRAVYIDCYVNKRIIPTTPAFMKGCGISYTTGVSWHLNAAGFIHVKIPNTQFSMVIEKPDQAHRRMDYLSTIARYRSEGRDIVYIEEKCVHPKYIDSSYNMRDVIKSSSWAYMFVAVSKKGINHLSYFNAVDYYKTNLLNVISSLEKPCVLVMREKAHHEKNMCPLPSSNSTKKQMSVFLTINMIPHSPEAPKAELYDLIQRSKNNCKTELYSTDEILKACGHVLLRCPSRSENLSFLKKYWESYTAKTEDNRVLMTVKDELKQILESMDTEEWEIWESELIAREKQMYTEDLQVEEIIDSLTAMARSEKLSPQDFRQFAMDTQVDTVYDDILLIS